MAHSRVLSIVDLSDQEIEAWRVLAAAAAEPNPYFEPEMLVPAVRALSGGADLKILVVERGPGDADGDQGAGRRSPGWWAALPFEMVPGDRHWPWRHASTGSDFLALYCPLGTR
ncbi:hypothetical protein NKG05_19880 [Oerskovia sp. M15]